MRHWLWRVMGVLSLGGGFYGMILVLSAALEGGPIEQWLILIFCCALNLVFMWSGLRLLERAPGAERLNIICWWSQILMVDTPIVKLVYYYGASAVVSLKWEAGGTVGFGADANLGTSVRLSYMQGDVPWEFGINVLALLFAVWGGHLLRRQAQTASLEVW
jgi:hypothetical protein